jgi:hypothetical protein
VTTTSEHTHQDFPAVDRVAEELRDDLMRAARAHSDARPRLLRRRRILGGIVAVTLIGAPAGLAGAGVFDSESAVISYECNAARAELEPLEPMAGLPVDGPGAPEQVLEETWEIPGDVCAPAPERTRLPALPGS